MTALYITLIGTACALFVWACERWTGENEYDD